MFLRKNTILFVAANTVLLCFVFLSPNVSATELSIENNYEEIYLADACDCGENSYSCVIENGTQLCECKYRYRQEGNSCTAYCRETWDCDNGAPCVNESCQCLPGTSGVFCTTVDECVGGKGPLMCGDPEDVYCKYDVDTQKPCCHCRIFEYLYHPQTRKCIECDCGKLGSCSLVDGKKTCDCNEGTALRDTSFFGGIKTQCVDCNCLNNSEGCSFKGLSEKICKCVNGTSPFNGFIGTICQDCNCGPHGQCVFEGRSKYCICDPGYSTFLNLEGTERTCKRCDCGKNGECYFEKEVQQCRCDPGYALRDGKCTACQCYADNKTVDCTFTDKVQTCLCPPGYETAKFFCTDIDECTNGNNSCPPTTECVNTMGSYECKCKEGYTPVSDGKDPKYYGCEDIDECEDPSLCPPNHTVCTNSVGSYSCVCEGGYVPVHPNPSPKVAGCEKKMDEKSKGSGWTTALIVMGVLICVSAVGVVLVILRRRNARRDLGMDTPFQHMKT